MKSYGERRRVEKVPVEEFEERVGLLWELDEIAALGLEADDDNGSFDTSRLEELDEFCQSHPELHIVTSLDDDTYLNDVAIANRVAYFLAKGSREPLIGVSPEA